MQRGVSGARHQVRLHEQLSKLPMHLHMQLREGAAGCDSSQKLILMTLHQRDQSGKLVVPVGRIGPRDVAGVAQMFAASID